MSKSFLFSLGGKNVFLLQLLSFPWETCLFRSSSSYTSQSVWELNFPPTVLFRVFSFFCRTKQQRNQTLDTSTILTSANHLFVPPLPPCGRGFSPEVGEFGEWNLVEVSHSHVPWWLFPTPPTSENRIFYSSSGRQKRRRKKDGTKKTASSVQKRATIDL